jgi:hypothetical protein
MIDSNKIREHMDVVGADGEPVGTVDGVEVDRIKLTKGSGPAGHEGHHNYLPTDLVATVEGNQVRLRATAASALVYLQEGEGADLSVNGQTRREEEETEAMASYGEEDAG